MGIVAFLNAPRLVCMSYDGPALGRSALDLESAL